MYTHSIPPPYYFQTSRGRYPLPCLIFSGSPTSSGKGEKKHESARGRKMAALLSVCTGLRFPVCLGVLAPFQLLMIPTRCASKKAGRTSRNHGGKSPGKHYGYKKLDGTFVHAGAILATQRQIRWHPGFQVGLGRRQILYALEDGIVRFTKEVYVPHPDSPETNDVICRLPVGALLYKTFINVIPPKQEGRFKLVDML
ncbi:large ribosomal subunit protein bL27m [Microcaecilia unicolor]|uniref:Large ribosomal subunit protein bL27m n=1 Tax=Microcaecilia unicolor TaxID=1415580 RepID=A0A6P7YM49_9AMPH|nr:39S ribosomal protein L27, mitochondrial [Microcaecilia unicolor]